MGLNLDYIPSSFTQEYFVDKEDGTPLAGGTLTFYKDKARTQLKPVYRISGVAPNYTYDVLPNPITLSAVGTVQDLDNNDVVYYFYPYDEDGNLELYYMVVKNADEVEQFTREGQPNLSDESSLEIGLVNYIPNGQFLIHNDILNLADESLNGKIADAVTQIAPGGWTFERPSGSTASDFIIFDRYNEAVTNPTGSPRYSCRLYSQTADPSDLFKAIRLKFRDVNKFSLPTEQMWTLSFNSLSNISSSDRMSIYLIKNYGTGGSVSPEEKIHLDDVTVDSTATIYNVQFTFTSNVGKLIGTNDDDFIQFSFEVNPASPADIEITDVALLAGEINLTQFPPTTEAEFVYRSVAGWLPIPKADRSTLGLPFTLGLNGLEYDYGHIGRVYKTSVLYDADIHKNVLPPNGASYDTYALSAHGLPYKRLRDAYAVPDEEYTTYGSSKIPRYGTGNDRCTAAYDDATADFHIVINTKSTVAPNATDGTVATTFTFTPETPHGYKSTKITCVEAASITAGAYFTYHDDSERIYIVWYKKDGLGTKPAVAADYFIEIDIVAADTDLIIAEKTSVAINYRFFAVPDYSGAFLRSFGPDGYLDPDRTHRGNASGIIDTNFIWSVTGDHLGTFQDCQVQSHTHSVPMTLAKQDGSSTECFTPGAANVFDTWATGGNETRSRNRYVGVVIGF